MPAPVTADPPAVTAVVPTHERPELMRRAVRSILAQTYPGHIEVIVVFDASTPELPAFDVGPNRTLRALENRRVRGPSGSRNTGILAATGELIALLDDDDEWEATKLTEQIALLQAHPRAVVAGTAMVVDDGVRKHVRLLPDSLITHDHLLHSRLAGLHTSSLVLRREALLGDLGLFDEDLPQSYGEDYDLLLRASAIASIVAVNRPLVTVSWQGRSSFVGRWSDYAAGLQYILGKHPDIRSSRRGLARIEAQIALALAASGRRADGVRWAARALRRAPGQAQAWLALAVAARLTTGDRIARVLRRFGRGV